MLATIRTLRTPTARMGLRAMSSDRLEPQQAESLMQIGTRTIFDSDHGTHTSSLPILLSSVIAIWVPSPRSMRCLCSVAKLRTMRLSLCDPRTTCCCEPVLAALFPPTNTDDVQSLSHLEGPSTTFCGVVRTFHCLCVSSPRPSPRLDILHQCSCHSMLLHSAASVASMVGCLVCPSPPLQSCPTHYYSSASS